MARMQLMAIVAEAGRAEAGAGDAVTRAHLADLGARAQAVLDGPAGN
jgi:hypothetical protein